MKNFLSGLLLGVLATYWYLTQADALRAGLAAWWTRVSAPPGVERHR